MVNKTFTSGRLNIKILKLLLRGTQNPAIYFGLLNVPDYGPISENTNWTIIQSWKLNFIYRLPESKICTIKVVQNKLTISEKCFINKSKSNAFNL